MSFAETFKALSDPVRRDILTLLKGGPLPAGEIAARFHLTGATISYHLNVLKKAELVFESREKNYIYYQLNTSVLEDVLAWLAGLKGDGNHESPQPETVDSDLPADSPAGSGGRGAVEPPAGPGADAL